MGDLINLNKFRKKKAKVEKEKRADTNRRLHGRTRAEREHDEAQKARLDKQVRGAFLEREAAPVVSNDEKDTPAGATPRAPSSGDAEEP